MLACYACFSVAIAEMRIYESRATLLKTYRCCVRLQSMCVCVCVRACECVCVCVSVCVFV